MMEARIVMWIIVFLCAVNIHVFIKISEEWAVWVQEELINMYLHNICAAFEYIKIITA